MDQSLIAVMLVAAIAASILMGHVFKMNTGLFAIGFAYIIGCYYANIPVAVVAAAFPTRMFLTFFAVTFFYGMATANGTLEKLSLKIIYRFRHFPYLLPFILYAIATVIAAMGAGLYAVIAMMTPISLMLARKSGMHPVLATSICAGGGAGVGSNFIISFGGVVISGLVSLAGYVEESTAITMAVFWNVLIWRTILVAIFYVVYKGYKIASIEMDPPEPLDPVQKKTFILMLAVISVLLLPGMLNNALPGVGLLEKMSRNADVGFVAILASLVAIYFKLGDEKQAFARVPWATILTICGVGVLIGVATTVGIITKMGSWLGGNIPTPWMPLVIILVASAIGLFASGYSVIMPTLFPIVPHLAAASGLSPAFLFSLIAVPCFATGASPLSSGGGLIMASIPAEDEESVKLLFYTLLFILCPINTLVFIFMAYTGLYVG